MPNPTLETIRLVESSIAENSGRYGKYQLWKMLPKKVMYQTFQKIIGYLSANGKIELKENKLFWIFHNNQDEEIFTNKETSLDKGVLE